MFSIQKCCNLSSRCYYDLIETKQIEENIMSNERLQWLLVGQFEQKAVNVKDKLTTKPAKLGIASPGVKVVKADPSYHNKGFKW
ncbi:hypothetical protein PQB73_gp002 [Cronobacter phage LPCS28]|uniref:Uncharacterized protein n=2 Tax=Straboviridae TaxID=2946170 RepID=A0AAE9K629_9CAUD|nr:hypothetical protein PQB73_gp002 [Cronobacter phage LPCS28]UNY46909.1 hypothetical protein EHEKIMEA_00002 [Cronobacter phage LPCS28]